jgi:hypothetical protein
MKPKDTIEIHYDDCRFDVHYHLGETLGVWIGSREIMRFLDSKELEELEKATKAKIISDHEPSEPLEDYICS